MNDFVTLKLHESTPAPTENPGVDVRVLTAETVPLVWLSLLTEADLERRAFWEGSSSLQPVSWADQVSAAYATPGFDRIPPLEVSWPVARARLRSAVTGLQVRGDSWAGPVAGWEARLEALAERSPTRLVVLDLKAASALFEDAGAFVRALLQGIHWWSDPDGTVRPEVETELELTGGPVEEAQVSLAEGTRPVVAQPRSAGKGMVDASIVVVLSTCTLMTFWLTGSVWWAGAVVLLAIAGMGWSIFRQSRRQDVPRLRILHPVSETVTVRPPLLPVLVCTLLVLGGLLDLWGQLHRVQGPCCSRAYYNYWPARTWTELWVAGAFVMLGVASQTVRLRAEQVTVMWLLGLVRLSRPAAQVTAEPVGLTVPRTQERVAGLQLRLGWLGITITEEQAGYEALKDAFTDGRIESP